jgi:hypothetical protein
MLAGTAVPAGPVHISAVLRRWLLELQQQDRHAA